MLGSKTTNSSPPHLPTRSLIRRELFTVDHGAQDDVSASVAEPVIARFEVVDVDDQHAQLRAAGSAVAEEPTECLLGSTAIGDSGQRARPGDDVGERSGFAVASGPMRSSTTSPPQQRALSPSSADQCCDQDACEA